MCIVRFTMQIPKKLYGKGNFGKVSCASMLPAKNLGQLSKIHLQILMKTTDQFFFFYKIVIPYTINYLNTVFHFSISQASICLKLTHMHQHLITADLFSMLSSIFFFKCQILETKFRYELMYNLLTYYCQNFIFQKYDPKQYGKKLQNLSV